MPMDKVLIRKPSGERHTQTKEPCEGGDRDRSDVVTGQGVPRNPRSSEEERKVILQSLQKAHNNSVDILISNFQICAKINICCFKPLSL